jgi:signal transduction histidine kinase/CheY-like chemotaxis protein
MKWYHKVTLLTLCALIGRADIARGSSTEFGQPPFRTFTDHDYGERKNLYTPIQDHQGRMLFGSQNAISTFDNSRWETIPAPDTGFIQSFAVDDHGTVWFCSSSEIGYVSEMAGADRVLKVASGAFGTSARIITQGEAVYVATGERLLVWSNGRLSGYPWPSSSIEPTSLSLFHDQITVGDQNGFIYEFEKESFKPIVQSVSSDAGPVLAIIDCSIADGLIVRRSGMFQKIGSNLVSWKSEIDALLHRFDIYAAKWVLHKYLAVLLENNGVYLLDQKGRLVESLTLNNGLEDAGFRGVAEDRDGGLWICGDAEITRLQCDASWTLFGHQLGLPSGIVTSVVRYQGKVYTGTGHGVYVLSAGEASGEAPHFIPFGNRNERIYGIQLNRSNAFACSSSGLYSINSATSTLDRVASGSLDIAPSKIDPARLFLCTRAGLESVRNVNGQWLSEGVLPQFPYLIEGAVEADDGDLFIFTENDGFYRVQLRKNAPLPFEGAKVEEILDPQNHRIASADRLMVHWQGKILFIGRAGSWQLRNETNQLAPFHLPASLLSREIVDIANSQLPDDFLWVVSQGDPDGSPLSSEIGRLYPSGRYEALSHAITDLPREVNDIWDESIDGNSVAWIAGHHGLFRVLLDNAAVNHRKFELYASQIRSADGEIVPFGQERHLTLKYDARDFEIRFGTDHFSAGNELYYQARLEGKTNHILPTTSTPVWRSGALNEGNYLLHVHATDSNGVESKEYTLAFAIEPPWYRTLWMEIVYVLAILACFCVSNRWRTYRMRLRQRELIRLVDLRTRELREHELKLQNAKEIAENARQTADLAREKAETANRAKTAFLANMSHELRTPINSILGYTQILLRRIHGDADQSSHLKTILSSGGHLLDMINEVLDLSRVESGKVSISLQAVELPKFIAGVVEEFQLRATRGNLNFIYEIERNLPQWIETDPLRLRQVLYNLLGNAMKFTAEGSVTLCVYVTAEWLRFEVKDTGQGIPPEDLAFLFKPFYQAGNNQLIGQGVGLGLYISKQIVELLGGRISAVSQPGKGSTFAFEIARTDTKPHDAEVYSRTIVGYEGPRRRILIVDDEALNRALLRELLAMVGFDSVEAGSPAEAFTLLHDPFDAVISDIRMPGQDGHTFCKNLRSFKMTKRLVIIASSASVFADDERQARASGFTDFLPKPILEEELFHILGTHLRLKWIYREDQAPEIDQASPV